eukprot:SAG31_NODE_20378_length_576_cov_1.088050_2_plen_44_part_01
MPGLAHMPGEVLDLIGLHLTHEERCKMGRAITNVNGMQYLRRYK